MNVRGPVKYLAAILGASAATGLVAFVANTTGVSNVTLLYIPVILVAAVYLGMGPALMAAFVSAVEYDFFLIRPFFTFTIAQVEDLLAFCIFVIVALLTSQLAAGARARTQAAQQRARESQMLYELGQALMSSSDVDQILESITDRVVQVFNVDRSSIFLPGEQAQMRLAAETLRGSQRDRASLAAASWVFQRGTQVGLEAPGIGGSDNRRVYAPLRAGDRIVGVMEVGPKTSGKALDPSERRLVTSFAAQAALVVDRAQGEEERQRLAVAEESDRLKSALLSAVSHDLRTPLSAIKASASALLLDDALWHRREAEPLLETIDQESDHLNRMVGNLLDLSRIEAGILRPVLDWYEVDELMSSLIFRLKTLVQDRKVTSHVQPGLPAVQLDRVRFEELMINLVENGARYSSADSAIQIEVSGDLEQLSFSVVDHGRGIPLSLQARVFDSFFRLREHGDHEPGTGLGLAIAKGIAEAHGGKLILSDTPGGGATFTFTLPLKQVEAAAS